MCRGWKAGVEREIGMQRDERLVDRQGERRSGAGEGGVEEGVASMERGAIRFVVAVDKRLGLETAGAREEMRDCVLESRRQTAMQTMEEGR